MEVQVLSWAPIVTTHLDKISRPCQTLYGLFCGICRLYKKCTERECTERRIDMICRCRICGKESETLFRVELNSGKISIFFNCCDSCRGEMEKKALVWCRCGNIWLDENGEDRKVSHCYVCKEAQIATTL